MENTTLRILRRKNEELLTISRGELVPGHRDEVQIFPFQQDAPCRVVAMASLRIETAGNHDDWLRKTITVMRFQRQGHDVTAGCVVAAVDNLFIYKALGNAAVHGGGSA